MSDQDDLTIKIQIGTRATMNAGTPRVGPWTYHHVLPVRLYFMAAWTMLRVAKHRDCWTSTRKICREALHSMCQYKANEQRISLFLDRIDDNPSDLDLTNNAKLCASPPAGGFGGPNPGQRLNDPHDLPESVKPVSVSANWFALIGQVGWELKSNFGLRVMPAPNSVVTQTQKMMYWCEMCETMAGSLKGIGDIGVQRFDPTDWVMGDGTAWTMLQGQTVAAQPNMPLRMRRRADAVGYRDIDAPATFPANITYTQRYQDYIKRAP